ncbi:RNA polymerase sigma factor, partial [Sedimentibacter sp.]|uniref:RNA polymerase sigma factor n=1 Tax=Sedimentibacter sp. TaxID=1960295 RepID=UPI0037DA372F
MSVSLQDQYDKVYRYCYFKVNNKEIAEDLTQETFLKYFSQTSYINRGVYANLKIGQLAHRKLGQ